MAKKTSRVHAKSKKASRSVAGAVAKQLPGWKVLPSRKRRVTEADTPKNLQSGPSAAELRAKFFGSQARADDSVKATAQEYQKPKATVIRVARDVEGAAPKVADVRDGKVKIVQG